MHGSFSSVAHSSTSCVSGYLGISSSFQCPGAVADSPRRHSLCSRASSQHQLNTGVRLGSSLGLGSAGACLVSSAARRAVAPPCGAQRLSQQFHTWCATVSGPH